MRRRGRPRHPDILTPRQWEVLDYLREGLSDQQIADAMGLSLSRRRQVPRIRDQLAKLGVASREEAAIWMPGVEPNRLSRILLLFGTATAIGVTLAVLAWGVSRAGTGNSAQHPLIGQDHWHAAYEIIVCGVRQPNAPTWEGGIHTHGDGIIHIDPFTANEEGLGARLTQWFDDGGGY